MVNKLVQLRVGNTERLKWSIDDSWVMKTTIQINGELISEMVVNGELMITALIDLLFK